MIVLVSANSAGDMPAVAENARREIAQVDAQVPVDGITLGQANMSFTYWGPRLAAGIASAFGVLALLLATMGLYSVMTYAVSQRTREIGTRMALGAQIGDVLRLVVGHGMRMVVIGIVLGLGFALALTRLLANLLLGIGAVDPITFIGMTILLFVVALLACYIPARRAAKIDPVKAMRYE
jgi:putative ABC transport system permease protein